MRDRRIERKREKKRGKRQNLFSDLEVNVQLSVLNHEFGVLYQLLLLRMSSGLTEDTVHFVLRGLKTIKFSIISNQPCQFKGTYQLTVQSRD